MIAYFDTSALVPLLINEPTSEICRKVWNSASTVLSTILAHTEASAALAQAERQDRIDVPEHAAALALLELIWDRTDVIGTAEPIIRRASQLSAVYSLRAYDAVHCASAEFLTGSDVVAVSGDRRLLAAWHALGFHTVDTGVA